jgi:uncharacterized protein (DUF1501 family)
MERNHGCPDCDASRRSVVAGAGKAALLALAAPLVLPRFAFARGGGGGSQDVLVNIFLRGGMDGLTLCPPIGDRHYYEARPTLAVPRPGSGGNAAIDLNGYFGLAPGAAGLLRPYQDGKLALVHASGSPDPTRSHFDAMAYVEYGIPLQNFNTVSDGWLGRHLQNTPPLGGGPLRGLTVDYVTPTSFAGAPQTVAAADPASFLFPGDPQSAGRRRSKLEEMYQNAGDPMAGGALNGCSAIDLLAQVDFARYVPANGASYPQTTFGLGLMKIAALIKADLGLESFTIDIGNFDTHADEGPVDGRLNDLLVELCNSLEAFYLDLRSEMDHVVVVAMSEFGRRVAENASKGTDHGHGNCMIVIGGHIDGGRVVTHKWPGLAPPDLDDGDLAVTIDYRDIFGEILVNRLCEPSLDKVFPNCTPQFRGITK